MHAAPGQDEFDLWAVSRDQLEDRSPSAKYVSRDVIGYDDLDRNGVWRTDPNMDRCGCLKAFRSAGRLIITDTGCMLRRGVGPGLKTSLGDLHRFITAGGRSLQGAGPGCLGRWSRSACMCGLCMRRHWSVSLVEAELGYPSHWAGA